MATSSSTMTVSIDELKPGMFVSELDISWIKSPFFRHRRLITKVDEVVLLKNAGVKKVVIDLTKSQLDEKSGPNNAPEEAPAKPEEDIKESTQPETVEPPAPTPSVSIQEELKAAKILEKETFATIDKVHNQIESGEAIDVKVFDDVIEKTIASVDRNNKALLSLLNKSQENSKLAGHHFRVLSLATALAKELTLTDQQKEFLGQAALLHDSGWVKLPAQLIGKGKPYKPTEKALVQQHIAIFKKVLEAGSNLHDEVITIIEQHHERGDGSGYPKKLKEDSIHPLAAILGLCDHYDELTHGLDERPGILAKNALSLLYKESQDGKWRKESITALVHMMGVYPLGSAVALNTGEKGIIVDIHAEEPLKPVVKIFYNRSGQPISNPQEIDLAKQKAGSPEKTIEAIIDPNKQGVDPKGILKWNDE